MPSDDILDTILSENDSITGFGNMELMRQADRLARRKAALELDARNSAQQLGLYAPQSGPITSPSFTSAVTGTQVAGPAIKRPLLGSLAPLIADTARGAQEDQLDKDMSGYNRLQAAVAARVMREMPTAGDAPGPYGQPVPTQPTQQQMLAWAQRAAQIPSLAPLANAFMAEAVKLPAAQAAQLWEKTKFEVQQKLERDKFLHEQGKPVAVNQVGLFERDPNSPTGYRQVPGTSPSGTLQPVTNPVTGNVSSFNNRTGAVTPSEGGAGAGVKSGEVIKQEQDTKTKLQNIDGITTMLDDAMPHIGKVNSGVGGAAKDWYDSNLGGPGFSGSSTESTRARKALAVLGENLKPYYNRPPGDPTGKEVERWGVAMGNLSAAIQNGGDTTEAINTLRKILADQRARLLATQPGTDTSVGAPVEGSSKLRAPAAPDNRTPTRPPSGVSSADLEAQYRAAKDPGERAALANRLNTLGVPVVESRQQYDRLPRGTRYLDANGVAGVKK